MKFSRLLAITALAALAIAGCKKPQEDFGPANLEVSTTSLSFDTSEAMQNVDVTATRDWEVVVSDDAKAWLSAEPVSGTASKTAQKVGVAVLANNDFDRSGTVTFNLISSGLTLKSVEVAVSQKGQKGSNKHEGTKEDPYNASEALAMVKNGTYASGVEVYVKGKISEISTTDYPGNSYGNATYWISDDGTTTGQFEIFRGYGLGGEKMTTSDYIKVGDEVIVCGELSLHNTTPEMAQGSWIYSLNGTVKEKETPDAGTPKGSGTLEDPYNPAGAAAAVANLTWTSNDNYQTTEPVYVRGKISRIADKGTYTEGGTYGNASFYVVDAEDGTGEFYMFRILYLGNKKFVSGQTDIKEGDEVIVYGKLMNYRGNTPETEAGSAYLYSLNGQTSGGDTPDAGTPKGSGTLEDPYNPAGAVAAVADLTWTANDNYESTDPVYVKGKISRIADKGTYAESGTFGNATFFIVDAEDGTGEFYVFRTLYLGNQKYAEGQTDIKVGDEVVVYGKLMNYKGNTPETVAGESYLYSLNGVIDADEYFSVNPLELNVSAVATSATFNISSNVDWTVETDNEMFYPDKLSGNGDATITLSFPANESESSRTANITVRTSAEVATKSYTIVITQGAPGSGDGATVVFDLTAQGYGNAEEVSSLTIDGVTLAFNKGTNSNTPKFYNSGNAVRVYGGGFLTLSSADNTITKVEFTFGSGDGTNELSADSGSLSGNTWTGEASSVKFNVGGSTGHRRFAKLVVTLGDGGSQGGGEEPGGDDTPGQATAKGSGTLEDPYNPAGAAAAAANLTWTANDNYESTDPVYVKGKISKIASKGTFTESGFGNATFYIVDAEDGTGEFYIFRTLYLGNQKFVSGQTDIKVGDEVVVYGKLMNYKGNTPETVANESYLYSLNGQTADGGSQGGGEGNAPIEISVADFLSAGESSEQPYQLTGTVGNISNTTYGNFYLTDDSGTVYVYGLTATNLGYGASNDKSFASLAISEGDNITIEGFRGSYTNNSTGVKTDEVLYAYLVKKNDSGSGGDTVISFGVDKTEIAAAAGATSATFNVKGNVAWTATCDNQEFTLDKTSGTGAAAVKITFEANTDTENAKVANITVSTDADVQTKSYTVVLTQAAAEAPAEGTTLVVFEQDEVKSTDMTGTKEGVTWINSSDYGSTVPTELRIYKGQQLTISSSTTKIEKIVFTCTANGANKYGPGNLVPDTGKYAFEEDGATGTWTGSASTVYFTSGDNQTRIVRIEVTLGSESSGGGSDSGSTGSKYPLIDSDIRSLLLAYRSPYQTYRVTGFIGDDLDATKGVFTLSDDTGSILVKGVTAGRRLYGDLNDNSFSKLGLGVGDQITLIGYRDGYKEENYFSYAYYVDGKSSTLSAEPSSITVDATATSATFTVSGNVAWTAATDNSAFSLSPASGPSGSTLVTVNFDANTDAQNARTCNITVTDASGAYTAKVVITQDKYEAPCASIAEISAKITSSDRNNPSSYEARLATPAVVSYVNGSNVFMQDATGGIVLYRSNSGLAPGNTVGGSFSGTGYKYNALPEITSIEGATIGQGSAPDPEVVTIATLLADFDSYLSKLVKIEGVTIVGSTDGTKKASVTITQGNDQMILYTQVASIKLQNGAKGDVIVIPTIFNTTKEAGLWEQDNFIADPNAKTFSVSTEKLSVSADAGTVTFNVGGNVSWTVTSSNQSFTVSPSSGTGEGTVTITYPANTSETSTRTANITVSTTDDVTTKSYTVVVTQAAAGSGDGGTVTFVAGTDKTSSTAAGHEVLTKDGITLDVSNGALYRTDNYRVYKNETITISSSVGTITKIEFTCPSSNPASNFSAPQDGTWDGANGTWTGSASSVSLKATAAQVRATKIVVTYN